MIISLYRSVYMFIFVVMHHVTDQLPQFELCTLWAAQFTPAAGVQSYRLSLFHMTDDRTSFGNRRLKLYVLKLWN